MDVHVIVDGQRMAFRDGSYRFAPRSQRFVKFIFDLSDDWSGLTIFAQWIQCGNAYNAYLDSNGCVYLPHEIVNGTCLMMLYGTGSGGVIGTTSPIKLNISDDIFVADAESTVIAQSLYDQLVARMSQYVPLDRVATLQEVIDALGL